MFKKYSKNSKNTNLQNTFFYKTCVLKKININNRRGEHTKNIITLIV